MSDQNIIATTHPSVPQFEAIMDDLSRFPFRFSYGDTAYTGFDGFTVKKKETRPLLRGYETTLLLTHPRIPAIFSLMTRVFSYEGAYEYAIYITNETERETDVFTDLAFEMFFPGHSAVLKGMEGDGGVSWHHEFEIDLTTAPDRRVGFESTSGRPTHHVFPYYNLCHGDGDGNTGTFIAIGWPGTWKSEFIYEDGVTTLRAGQRRVNTTLRPHEILRTPLMAFVEYNGLDTDSQINAWRHYFIRDVMPRRDGELPRSVTATVSGVVQGNASENLMRRLMTYEENGIPSDAVWIDAGWYVGAHGEEIPWPLTGTHLVDTRRFPHGMADIGDYCRQRGMEMLIWFEPEVIRVNRKDFLLTQKDFCEEWLLGCVSEGTWLEGELLDMGNPHAREWLLNRVCRVLDDGQVTVYRQDFNSDPSVAWDRHDTPTRLGMTENQYVQGYLDYWDTLLKKYPNLLIDSCASGGGRNDLETMKRSVPLHYSDLFDGGLPNYHDKTRMTQSLFAWFPYFKNDNHYDNIYGWRMTFAPWANMCYRTEPAKDDEAAWAVLRRIYGEYRQIKDYFYAEYYPLTPYSDERDRWNGWEFYDPDMGKGFASLSCNPDSQSLEKTFTLKGLDRDRLYTVNDFDGLLSVTATGEELSTTGFTIQVPEAPYCVILLIDSKA